MISSTSSKIFNSIDETIGNTPLVRLSKLKKHFNLQGNIIAKLEFFNPLGSVKDRIGLAMINFAEKKKLINTNSTIIEATSGNTGIALAFICASRGYKLILTMPDSMSVEKKKDAQIFWCQINTYSKKTWYDWSHEKSKRDKRKNIKQHNIKSI